MTLEETGLLFDHIVHCYPQFTADLAKLRTWQDVLKSVTLETALQNLNQYSSNPKNQYPPHPGALASEDKTDIDQYHEKLKLAGEQALAEFHQRNENPVRPTPEQIKKVREIFAKSRN